MNGKNSEKDISDLKTLEITRQRNFRILDLFSNFLNLEPDFIKSDLIEELTKSCKVSTLEAYTAILSAAFGIDSEENEEDRIFEREYLNRAVEQLSPEKYINVGYMKKIKFPSVKRNNWEMRISSYAPYEAFVCRGLTTKEDFSEIPHIGFFTEKFQFPAVYENGREWMTVTPNEIETMEEPIAEASGRVITLGLGLGYFCHEVSQKKDVTSVTVIERDENVISLFKEFILPQFDHREKIEIIHADALDYLAKNDPNDSFDFMFADLWHDSSDGLDLYILLKKLERKAEKPSKLIRRYWIERSILSRLRWLVYSEITADNAPQMLKSMNFESLKTLLSDSSLASLAADIELSKKTYQ